MANTFLPAPGSPANIVPSMIGPQGFQPAITGGGAGGGANSAMQGLHQALMLAKMRQGQSPIAPNGQFSPSAAAGSQMAPLQQQPNMDPMAMGNGGPQLA